MATEKPSKVVYLHNATHMALKLKAVRLGVKLHVAAEQVLRNALSEEIEEAEKIIANTKKRK